MPSCSSSSVQAPDDFSTWLSGVLRRAFPIFLMQKILLQKMHPFRSWGGNKKNPCVSFDTIMKILFLKLANTSFLWIIFFLIFLAETFFKLYRMSLVGIVWAEPIGIKCSIRRMHKGTKRNSWTEWKINKEKCRKERKNESRREGNDGF